jgi:hypothetical protein
MVAMGPAMGLGDKLSKETFRNVVLALLAAAAIRLIWSAF